MLRDQEAFVLNSSPPPQECPCGNRVRAGDTQWDEAAGRGVGDETQRSLKDAVLGAGHHVGHTWGWELSLLRKTLHWISWPCQLLQARGSHTLLTQDMVSFSYQGPVKF